MSYIDMARDAGYRGEEARQMAAVIEEDHRRQWEEEQARHEQWLEDMRLAEEIEDHPCPTCDGEGTVDLGTCMDCGGDGTELAYQ